MLSSLKKLSFSVQLFIALLLVHFCFIPQKAAAASLTLQPGAEGKDTFVVPAPMCDLNYGNATLLDVGGYYCAPSNQGQSYLQFDLTSIPGDSTVSSVELKIYYYQNSGPVNDPLTVSLYQVTGTWDETVITWGSKPADSGSVVSSTTIGDTEYGWYSFNITSLVANWLNGIANYGLVIKGSNNSAKYFYSGDYTVDSSLRPKLEISYEPAGGDAPPGDGGTADTFGGDNGSGGQNPTTNPTGTSTVNAAPSGQTAPVITPVTITNTIRRAPIEAAEAVISAAEITSRAVKELSDSKSIYIPVVIGGIASAATTATLFVESLATGFSIKEFLIMLINLIAAAFSFRKKDKFGIVYDQTTGKPLKGAIILVFMFPAIRLVSVKTTDKAGHFIFQLKPGQYAVSVKKSGFIFPSREAKGAGVYLGQTLNLKESEPVNLKIPIDPDPNAVAKKSGLRLVAVSSFVRHTVLVLGSALTAYLLINNPNFKNFILLACYLILWSVEYLIQNRILKFSRIIDAFSKTPVALAIIRIVKPGGKIQQTFVSDDQGLVMPYSESPKNKIVIERGGYQKFESELKNKGFIEKKTYPLNKTAQNE